MNYKMFAAALQVRMSSRSNPCHGEIVSATPHPASPHGGEVKMCDSPPGSGRCASGADLPAERGGEYLALPIDRRSREAHQCRPKTVQLDYLELMKRSVHETARLVADALQRVARHDQLDHAPHLFVAERTG